jgi:two-component system response regulator YesN
MPKRETRERRKRLLHDACAVIKREYRDPDLVVADVAVAVGVSSRQLQRIFREEGVGDFRGYLLSLRMEKATELLSREKNPLPIRVAARRVGYRQASGLRQAFLRFYGYNPSEIQVPTPQEELYGEVNPD